MAAPLSARFLVKLLLIARELLGLIYKHHQSGFRPLLPVATCLLSNTSDWYFNLDDGKCTGIMLVDLKIDTVNHESLIRKISHNGINHIELQWFCSSLYNRRQCCDGPVTL